MQISIKKIVFRLLLVIGKVECYSPIISFKEGSVLLNFTWSWLIGSFFRMLALSSPFASSFGRSLHHPESLPHVTFVVKSYRQVYSRGFIPGVLMTVLLDELMVSVIKEDPKLIWSFFILNAGSQRRSSREENFPKFSMNFRSGLSKDKCDWSVDFNHQQHYKLMFSQITRGLHVADELTEIHIPHACCVVDTSIYDVLLDFYFLASPNSCSFLLLWCFSVHFKITKSCT